MGKLVYRCYTEKKQGFDVEAQSITQELKERLDASNLSIRIVNRYDLQGIVAEQYDKIKNTVLSEPQTDVCTDEVFPVSKEAWMFGIEPLPGQFDQRADSCASCIQMLVGGVRPLVKTAKIYLVYGADIAQQEKIKAYLLNPIENRQAQLEKPITLEETVSPVAQVPEISGFITADKVQLQEIGRTYHLAMGLDDLLFMQQYFQQEEQRDPTETELRVIDTYWSDHCRHTTFQTILEEIAISDPEIQKAYTTYLAARREVYGEKADTRPETLMDVATIGAKVLKRRGLLPNLDESEEINACSIQIQAKVNGEVQDWLLMFKNETHNHPTEIEPFGGAATCIGGAIRDPLSGRAYVYQAMRITGAGDPRTRLEDTLPGKLSQRRITQGAAAGYSSYGNQIGLATGLVHEVYHPGYVAKRMEVGAVVGAAPKENVIRSQPLPGDVVLLLGGRTGRDGIGGATGSSKMQDTASLSECAAEVQKGNAPEERKIQRLFRNPTVAKMIKRCNDFGAGGVSVAIGELADGLHITLDHVRKKYEGLGGTELAISESQERMAVVISPNDMDAFIAAAERENLEAYAVAHVTASPRMVMEYQGREICNLSRTFLSSNGAPKYASARIEVQQPYMPELASGADMREKMLSMVQDLRYCSRRSLAEWFDSTVGAGSVLSPYSGIYQKTPAQAMAALIPALEGESETCSVMAFGLDPYHGASNPFTAARDAVVQSVARLVASGCDVSQVYLSFQEYFERLGTDNIRWGKPLASLLGALSAQLELQVAAIGGKDSMSGTFLDLDVPPTFISFAVAPCEAACVLSPEFKEADHYVTLLMPGETLGDTRNMWLQFQSLPQVYSAFAVTEGGIAEGIFKMSLGNRIGFTDAEHASMDVAQWFQYMPGALLVETAEPLSFGILLGKTTQTPELHIAGGVCTLDELEAAWEAPLAPIFKGYVEQKGDVQCISYTKPNILAAKSQLAQPHAVIPVFPGTNCEYDTARAIQRAGASAEMIVIRNLTPQLLEDSILQLKEAISRSQMLLFPGGFSGGDEPDGSAKFIVSMFRNPEITDAVHQLLYQNDGLILGICNGFQALVKLGLLPFGEIRPMDASCPTLTYNQIGRHQAKYGTTRVASVKSPWLSQCNVGDLHTIAFSHGEGRFVASPELLQQMISNGQVATQYTDSRGIPSMDVSINPNGSVEAIEGILSPDGRIFGKMGHSERFGEHVAKDIYGNKNQPIFEAGVQYYK